MADAEAKANVFVKSEAYDGTQIKGPDFNLPYELDALLKSYETIGFQANGLARAIHLINKMVSNHCGRHMEPHKSTHYRRC